MYQCTQDIIDLFNKNYRQVARITFNGKHESFVIDESEIIQSGLVTDRYSVSGSKIELGSAIAAELTMKLKNYDGKYDETVFEGAELFVEIGIKKWDAHRWENAIVNYIPCGYFIVDTPPRALSTISISALDRMVLFDKDVDITQITFPITVENLIKRVCEICGVTIATDLSKLVNHNYSITAAPSSEYLTYRTLIQWCAFITATCAFMNHNGQLEFKWYTQTNYSVTPSERYSSDMYENDITLTGLVYTSSNNQVYVVGETDYSLTYNSCGLLQNNVEMALSNIYYAIRGFSYRPYEATIKPAPFLYPMDMIHYKDAKGITHNTIVTHVTSTINLGTTIAGSGETSTSNDRATTSGLTSQQSQALQEMKNSIEVTISSQELEGLDLSQIIANSMGFNLTIITSDDGSRNFFIHNGSSVSTSDCIYTLLNGAIAWTGNWNNGNPRWTYTITQNNNAVLDVLKRYKLTGDNLGEHTITKNHLTTSYVNEVELAISQAQSSALNSAKEYSDSQLSEAKDYVDEEVGKAKTYSDNNLTTAKAYTDSSLIPYSTTADMNTAIANAVKDFMTAADIQSLARLIFITGTDGVEYAGRLKVVDGKPVFEYDTTEGGNADG